MLFYVLTWICGIHRNLNMRTVCPALPGSGSNRSPPLIGDQSRFVYCLLRVLFPLGLATLEKPCGVTDHEEEAVWCYRPRRSRLQSRAFASRYFASLRNKSDWIDALLGRV